MLDIKNVKKKVSLDWQNAFPELGKFSQNKLYKIVGPLILGLELIKLPGGQEYRPHFVMYSLWDNDLKTCLSRPIMLNEFHDKKGLQFFISYEGHENNFSDAVKSIKNQSLIPLNGDITLKKIFKAIDEHSQKPPLDGIPNSYLHASLQESKLLIALCNDDKIYVQQILSEIKSVNWDLNHFKLWGVNLKEWMQSIEDKIRNKNQLLININNNKSDKKLDRIKKYNIIV